MDIYIPFQTQPEPVAKNVTSRLSDSNLLQNSRFIIHYLQQITIQETFYKT